MVKQSFSVYQASCFACKSILNNAWLFFATLLIWYALLCISGLLLAGSVFLHSKFITGIVIFFSFFIINTILIGFIRLAFQLYDAGKSSVATLFSGFKIIRKTFFSSLIYWSAVGGYNVLLIQVEKILPSNYAIIILLRFIMILPLIYMALRFWFFSFFIVDKNYSIIKAFKKSWHITKGREKLLLTLLLTFFSVLFFPLTTLLFIPFIVLTKTYIYKKMVQNDYKSF